MADGETVHARLVELVVTEISTVPVDPFTGDTVMVEFPRPPTLGVKSVGSADIAKPGRTLI